MKHSVFWAAGCDEKGGIYTCTYGKDGAVHPIAFLALDRIMYAIRRKDRMYVSLRAPFPDSINSGLLALHIQEDGSLVSCGNVQDAHGDVACHLCTNAEETMLYAAAYRGGTIAALPITREGALKPAKCVYDHRLPGITAHPHYVCWKNDLIAVDLGLEKVLFYQEDLIVDSISFPSGSGPRHLVLDQTGRYAYCVRQNDGQVSKLDLLKRRLLKSTGIKNWRPQESLAAIRLSKDERFLYVSARERDTIITYDISRDRLQLIGETSCGGQSPRDFDLSPDGKWLYCANEKTGNITRMQIGQDGIPTEAQTVLKCPGALCICF